MSVRERSATPGNLPFVLTIFAGSFLLFLVQPMIARMALPRLGGAPSVWSSAMLVYQALLLAGYAYAHWLGRFQPPRQVMIHLALLVIAGLTLPIGLLASTPPPAANPFLWVPWLLLLSVGPLFFVVSAQAPLIQRWFALKRGADPYPLYAASNLGSFGGLIAFPLLVEPLLPVGEQRWLWSIGYGLLVILVAWCGIGLPKSSPAAAAEGEGQAPTAREIVRWIVLAAVPSGLILSTTLHITTDIIAMPLLWVLPLGAYLLSFTVAFAARRGPANTIIRFAPLILLFACFAIFIDQSRIALIFCGISILNLFTASVALHSRLFESRPPTRYLTLFYLMMSVGGALGGLFCALIAPLIFDWTYEHLLLLVGAAALMIARNPFDRFVALWDGDELERSLTIGAGVLVVLLSLAGTGFALPYSSVANRLAGLAILAIAILAIGNRRLFACSVAALLMCAGGWQRVEFSATPGKMTRSFFGIYSVRQGPNNSRLLVHGTTVHGVQNLGSPARERMPTTYYVPRSGVGLAMTRAPQLFGPAARIGIVGLGTGTLACYARPGQRWTFYEIDPAVVRIARDPQRFSFLSQCAPNVPIEIGDARLLIEREPPASEDLLVVDAFSSDAVPMHLLTREAFADYRRLLSDRGLLLVHISNRYLDLMPVVAAAAAGGRWNARYRSYRPDWAGMQVNEYGSDWIALSPSGETMAALTHAGGWDALRPRPGFRPWTDDHASVLPLIKF